MEDLLRPVLIAAMMACLAAPDGRDPGVDVSRVGMAPTFLVFSFAGLEGILSERVLRGAAHHRAGYLASRVAELVILLILLKMANYIPLGWTSCGPMRRHWLSEPQSFATLMDFFTAAILVPAVAGLDLCRAGGRGSWTWNRIRGSPPEDKTSTRYYLWLTQPSPASDRRSNWIALAELFGWGGHSDLARPRCCCTLSFPETRIRPCPSCSTLPWASRC